MQLIHGDCLEVMKGIPDNSVDMVLTDPPYFKVKNEAWDRQWNEPDQFLSWLDTVIEQIERVLKPNGTLYLFASPQMRARVEVLVSNRMNTLPTITWVKPEGYHKRQYKEGLRAYFPQTEAVIFAEHYGADNIAKGEAGYQAKCDELRGFVFEPLLNYIKGEFHRAGMLNTSGKIAANVACGFSATSGGMASRHYFSRSQWWLPTREHYTALRTLLNSQGGDYLKREYDDLKREYDDLKREYDDLKREYESLRRPFNVTKHVPHTDVWTFGTVPFYKGKHPCEKPGDMLTHMVTASTNPGAVVLDCFMGSGTTGVACINTDRDFIGIELDENYFKIAQERINAAKAR